MTTQPLTRLPFEPLRRTVAKRVVLRAKCAPGVSLSDGLVSLWPRKSWQYAAYIRAQESGSLSWFAADKLAIDLGLHPALIWGEAWWEIEDRPTEGTRRAS